MFCIFAKSQIKAREIIDKRASDPRSSLYKSVANAVGVEQKQALIDIEVQSYFQRMKPVRITQEFSTPEIAIEALHIAQKSPDVYQSITMMKKAQKRNKSNIAQYNPRTGKPVLTWVQFNEVTE